MHPQGEHIMAALSQGIESPHDLSSKRPLLAAVFTQPRAPRQTQEAKKK